MRVTVITPPDPIVTVAEAKQHLKVQHAADDALIGGMVAAATQHIDGPDGGLGRAIGKQVLEARFDGFGAVLRLPYPPVIEVQSVKYLDAAAVEQTLDADLYELASGRLIEVPNVRWPMPLTRAGSVRVTYRAGYPNVPAPIKVAILLMVGDLYRNRETTSAVAMTKVPMSTTVEALLSPYRVFA